MSGEVGMKDKLLNQVSCRVKQDILKKKEQKTQSLIMPLCHMFGKSSTLQSYLLQTAAGRVEAGLHPTHIHHYQLVTEQRLKLYQLIGYFSMM